ncbi:unnamed protein product, partial [Arabidopsis halleri]
FFWVKKALIGFRKLERDLRVLSSDLFSDLSNWLILSIYSSLSTNQAASIFFLLLSFLIND